MIIIFIMYILMYILLKNTLKENKDIKRVIIIGLMIETALLIVYRLNLNYIGREVYYSDAEVYWKHTLELIKYGTVSNYRNYNPLYYYICYIIQKTSPFIWAGWNNIFNIACINMAVVIIVKNYLKSNIKIQNVKYLIISVMYNPFIIYGLMRNLKDAVFLLMTYMVCYLYSRLYKTKQIFDIIINLLLIIIFSYLFTLIRPWGFAISICAFVLYIITIIITKIKRKRTNINKKNIMYILMGSMLLIIAAYFTAPIILVNIRVWFPTIKSALLKKNIFHIIIGIAKFILAPGPVRAFLGAKYFEHYTISGNIMCAIGSAMWWISIIIMITNIILQRKKIKKVFNDNFALITFLVTIMYVLIYVIQYGGLAEIRLRSIVYIFIYSVFFKIFNILKIKENKKAYIFFIIVGIVAFSAATIIGMK